MRLLSKYLHEVGSYGLAGGLAAQLVFLGAEQEGMDQVYAIGKWLIVPSFLLCVLSGLLAMIVRPTFFTKGWVWLKIILTIPTLYSTLATYPGVAWFHGKRDTSQLWVALVASLVVTGLSVWRPRGVLIPERRSR